MTKSKIKLAKFYKHNYSELVISPLKVGKKCKLGHRCGLCISCPGYTIIGITIVGNPNYPTFEVKDNWCGLDADAFTPHNRWGKWDE